MTFSTVDDSHLTRPKDGGAPTEKLPPMSFTGASVNPALHIHPGTGMRTTLAYFALAAVVVIVAASTMGIGLILFLIAPLALRFRWKTLRARIFGSGVKVSKDQMPELYQAYEELCKRLQLKKVPELYIVEDSLANGVAVRLGVQDIVLLTDDVIWGAVHAGDARILGFVLAHELAHVALGHTTHLRSSLRTALPSLSRCDEHTCDNVAHALVGDTDVAVKALTLLTVGPQLSRYVNAEQMRKQALESWRDKASVKAERSLTHPLLMRRIASLLTRSAN